MKERVRKGGKKTEREKERKEGGGSEQVEVTSRKGGNKGKER